MQDDPRGTMAPVIFHLPASEGDPQPTRQTITAMNSPKILMPCFTQFFMTFNFELPHFPAKTEMPPNL